MKTTKSPETIVRALTAIAREPQPGEHRIREAFLENVDALAAWFAKPSQLIVSLFTDGGDFAKADDLQIAKRVLVSIEERRDQLNATRRTAKAQEASEAAKWFAATATRDAYRMSVNLDALWGLLCDTSNDYIRFESPDGFAVPVLRERLAKARAILGKREDLTASLDSNGLHLSWKEGKAGLNFNAQPGARTSTNRDGKQEAYGAKADKHFGFLSVPVDFPVVPVAPRTRKESKPTRTAPKPSQEAPVAAPKAPEPVKASEPVREAKAAPKPSKAPEGYTDNGTRILVTIGDEANGPEAVIGLARALNATLVDARYRPRLDSRARYQKALGANYRLTGEAFDPAAALQLMSETNRPVLVVTRPDAPADCWRHWELAIPLRQYGIDTVHAFDYGDGRGLVGIPASELIRTMDLDVEPRAVSLTTFETLAA